MPFNVAEFRSNMISDGARPNLFEVTLTIPTFIDNAIAASQKSVFMCKTAQLPGSTIGQVPLYYFGREIKFAGNRTFADWSVQILNDEDFTIRNSMEAWMNSINSHATNIRNPSARGPSGYTVDAIVKQFAKTGEILKTYKFVGMYPLDLAPIDLDWGSNDTIEEYAVTFAYQWWETDTTT